MPENTHGLDRLLAAINAPAIYPVDTSRPYGFWSYAIGATRLTHQVGDIVTCVDTRDDYEFTAQIVQFANDDIGPCAVVVLHSDTTGFDHMALRSAAGVRCPMTADTAERLDLRDGGAA